MTVLAILGLILFVFLAHYLAKLFNGYTYKRFRFEFFEIRSAFAIAISYISLYVAYYIFENKDYF